MAFEEGFDLEFPQAEALTGQLLDQSTTVRQIVELVDSHMQG